MLKLLSSLCLILTTATSPLLATERMTIYGSQGSLHDSLGPATHVIDEEDFARRQSPDLVDYLEEIPGFHVQRTGAAGSFVSVFVRGVQLSRIIIAIDGVPVTDPSLAGGGYDLSHISIVNVSKIEVYKGAQSLQLGSDGLGGVINIVSKKTGDKILAAGELGSFDYQRFSATAASSIGEAFYAGFNIEDMQSDSYSDADDALGATEADGYHRQTLSGFASFDHGPWSASLNLISVSSEKDLDDFGPEDDENYVDNTDQLTTIFSLGLSLDKGDISLKLSQTDNERRFTNGIDDSDPEEVKSRFEGRKNFADLQWAMPLAESGRFTMGAQLNVEKADTDNGYGGLFEEEDRSHGFYTNYEFSLVDALSVELGLRYDDYDRSGEVTTGVFRLANTAPWGTLYTQAASAFKAPSLYQIYAPFYGNTALKPEKGMSYEVGYALNRGIAFVEAALFQNELKELIEFDSAYYNRQGLTSTRGAELRFGHIWKLVSLELNATYLDMSKNATRLRRRPQNKYGAIASFFMDDYRMAATYNWIGERDDGATSLDAYDVIHLTASWEKDSWRIYARVENLADKPYQTVEGYSAARRHLYGGVVWMM